MRAVVAVPDPVGVTDDVLTTYSDPEEAIGSVQFSTALVDVTLLAARPVGTPQESVAPTITTV